MAKTSTCIGILTSGGDSPGKLVAFVLQEGKHLCDSGGVVLGALHEEAHPLVVLRQFLCLWGCEADVVWREESVDELDGEIVLCYLVALSPQKTAV